MLEETISEYKTRTDFARMSDFEKLETMTAELETVADAFALLAREMYQYDSGEDGRTTALIHTFGLLAADFENRRVDLLEVVNRILADHMKKGGRT